MRRLFGLLRRLEGSLVNVLIQGESGTGKELVARALHEGSLVSEGPFVALNCGALDAGLARSELFGHRKGAFTGAIQASIGAFEAAHGGTLFLDEIGELSLEIQPSLLRVLESRSIVRVGEHQPRPISVRLIAATHKDLNAEAQAGRFRKDLLYRLNVVRLLVPPLRQRREDIEGLAQHFATQAGIYPLSVETIAALRTLPWEGNVRELRNAIEAFAAIGALPAPEDGEQDLAIERHIDIHAPYAENKERLLEKFTQAYLEMLLAKTGGNRTEAARIAGLERTYLSRLLCKLGYNKH
jgi:DNA-binding NtrC family response regulator